MGTHYTNEHQQCMFWIKKKEIGLTFDYIKVGYEGYTFHGHVFMLNVSMTTVVQVT